MTLPCAEELLFRNLLFFDLHEIIHIQLIRKSVFSWLSCNLVLDPSYPLRRAYGCWNHCCERKEWTPVEILLISDLRFPMRL